MEEKQQQREHNKRIAELRDRDLLGNPMEEPSGFSAEFLTKDYSQNSCTFREGVESTQKKEPCNPLAGFHPLPNQIWVDGRTLYKPRLRRNRNIAFAPN